MNCVKAIWNTTDCTEKSLQVKNAMKTVDKLSALCKNEHIYTTVCQSKSANEKWTSNIRPQKRPRWKVIVSQYDAVHYSSVGTVLMSLSSEHQTAGNAWTCLDIYIAPLIPCLPARQTITSFFCAGTEVDCPNINICTRFFGTGTRARRRQNSSEVCFNALEHSTGGWQSFHNVQTSYLRLSVSLWKRALGLRHTATCL